MRIAIFAYSWGWKQTHKLDKYQEQFVLSMSRLGFDVDVYIGNEFTADQGVLGWRGDIHLDNFEKHISQQTYLFALSFNNSMISAKMRSILSCPILTLIVDDFNHLFNHDWSRLHDQFSYADKIIVPSFSHLEKLTNERVDLKSKSVFLPSATSAPEQHQSGGEIEQYQILWVASLLDISGITLLFNSCSHNRQKIKALVAAIEDVQAGVEINRYRRFGVESIDQILEEHHWTWQFFEMQVQNLVSNKSRVDAASRLALLGLTLFGNPGWIDAGGYNPDILKISHDGNEIRSHEELIAKYNNAKICINVPQAQTGPALPYRILDIMASKSLLITQYHRNSDLFKLFGEDCPVVTYRTIDELYSLCDYYLSHEEERLEIVRKCNLLVSKGFSFTDRCLDILNLASISEPSKSMPCGKVAYIVGDQFAHFLTKSKVKGILKRTAKSLFKLIPLNLRRSIINNLKEF